jgi:succinate dehydrogenase / fumarate reductase iron-sulfur subunit
MGSANSKKITLNLKVWRQKGPSVEGCFKDYEVKDISTDASFLEMMDSLNEKIISEGSDDPIAFDHDCREGICGSCGFMINGSAHGPERSTTVCQLHMRHFKNGETLVLEPWRATAFPITKDLMVDRSAFDRIISSGGYVSVNTGSPQDGNAVLVSKKDADHAFEAATCIGCGACVASCKNASAMLFTAAKVAHLGLLPQGQVEREERVLNMVAQMDSEEFGACSNTGSCSVSCPKDISLVNIAMMNREYLSASLQKYDSKNSLGDG